MTFYMVRFSDMLVEWGLWRRIKQELFRTIKTNGGYCGYFLYIAFLFLFWGMRWTSSLYIFLYFRNKNERLVLECMKLAPKNIQIEWNLFVDGEEPRWLCRGVKDI